MKKFEMRYSKILTCVFLIIFEVAYAQNGPIKNTILEGIGKNFSANGILYDISQYGELGAATDFQSFNFDSNGHFKIILKLRKPSYFRIGRNVLFLTPGDKMEAFLDYNDPEAAKFSGNGSEANEYLRTTPFPKGGSFVESGKRITGRFVENWNSILAEAGKRKKELLSLKSINNNFKEYELGRIRADIINSLYYLKLYYEDVVPKDSLKSYFAEYDRLAPALFQEYAAGFYDTKLLVHPVYRGILEIINDYSNVKKRLNEEAVNDWLLAKMISSKLKHTVDIDSANALFAQTVKIRNQDYRNILEVIYKKQLSLSLSGRAAANIVAVDKLNNAVAFEQFKGRVIYIDLWATWCGPCMTEMPAFEKLKRAYSDNPAIVFISLSIDADLKSWKQYINSLKLSGLQWNVNRIKLADYLVEEVPRYIIIDKNFRIAHFFAPKPSAPETVKIIDSLVSEHGAPMEPKSSAFNKL
ncbi:MAG: TlpA family protein disulfide reductase [Niabella sp.]|nr:TlpA family protein disulfide reductase [Niabella sp.]